MRIAIEARALSSHQTGVKRYVDELFSGLIQFQCGHEFYIISTDERTYNDKHAHAIVVPLASDYHLNRWLNEDVPRAVASYTPDIIHFTKAAVPKSPPLPTVVTIYDVMPILLPSTQTLVRRWYWKRALFHAAKISDHIITISHTSKRDIHTMFNVPEQNITVTLPAINHRLFKPLSKDAVRNHIDARFKPIDNFILFVGTRDQRKNVCSIVRAVDRLKNRIPHHLVIVGKKAQRDDGAERLIQSLALTSRVHIFDGVSDVQLPVIYNAADLLILPSIYEGWGFPAQEAMACGTPVIVSNGGSLPEVAGDAGVVVPYAEENVKKRLRDKIFINRLADEILHLCSTEGLRKKRSAAGLRHVRNNSWVDVAKKTLEVYEMICFRKYNEKHSLHNKFK